MHTHSDKTSYHYDDSEFVRGIYECALVCVHCHQHWSKYPHHVILLTATLFTT